MSCYKSTCSRCHRVIECKLHETRIKMNFTGSERIKACYPTTVYANDQTLLIMVIFWGYAQIKEILTLK